MKTMVVSALTLLLGTASIASAATKTLVFGDSLSDAGNERVILGDAWNTDVYPTNQRTDTAVWADLIGSTFESGFNFAVGGARAVANDDNRPDFAAQRERFFNSGLDLSSVSEAAIWFGGNDFRDLLSAGVPTPAGVAQSSAAIIGEIVTGIGELSASGISDFVVFGMPDLSRAPAVASSPFAAEVRQAVEGYDGALQAAIAEVAAATGLNITFLDVIGATDSIFANAQALGFSNLVASACTEEQGEVVSCGDTTGFFFYDSIHPTGAVHELVAAAFGEATAAGETAVVPLPAGFPLMLTGVALFGLASRRRNKSRA